MFGRNHKKQLPESHRIQALSAALVLALMELEFSVEMLSKIPADGHEQEMLKVASLNTMREHIKVIQYALDNCGGLPPEVEQAATENIDLFAERAARRKRLRGGLTAEEMLDRFGL